MTTETNSPETGQDPLPGIAERFWRKIHREGGCPHDPHAWVECTNLLDELEYRKGDLAAKRVVRDRIDQHRENAAKALRTAAAELRHIDDLTDTDGTRKRPSVLATAPDGAGLDLAEAPLNWQALVRIADTDFVPRTLRGNPNAVLACIFTGREVGLDPMASLRLVDIIDGRPSLSAELTVALIRAAGHRISVVSETPDSCTVEGTRGDHRDHAMTITYRLGDAQRAGLVTVDDDGQPRARSRNGKPLPWETYTSDLLWARAVSRLARRLFPDVLAAPSRTAVASFVTGTMPETAPVDGLTVDEAVWTLGALLGEPVPSSGVDAEVFLRRICRLAVASQIVASDPLPSILASFGAVHVADLRASEIRSAASNAVEVIAGAYSSAVGRDITADRVPGALVEGLPERGEDL